MRWHCGYFAVFTYIFKIYYSSWKTAIILKFLKVVSCPPKCGCNFEHLINTWIHPQLCFMSFEILLGTRGASRQNGRWRISALHWVEHVDWHDATGNSCHFKGKLSVFPSLFLQMSVILIVVVLYHQDMNGYVSGHLVSYFWNSRIVELFVELTKQCSTFHRCTWWSPIQMIRRELR